MRLYNDTLLRSLLAHLQSLARKRAALAHEFASHPDATSEKVAAQHAGSRLDEIRDQWEIIRSDLVIVIGPEADLKPYGALAASGSFESDTRGFGKDPFRITLKALKLLADKARRSRPDVMLLKSWDVSAKDRPVDEQEEAA